MIFATIAYAFRYNIPFKFFYKLKTQSNRCSYWDTFFEKLKKYTTTYTPASLITYREPHFHYVEIPKGKTQLTGYYQSDKYFKNEYSRICDIIEIDAIKIKIKNQNLKYDFENTISLHFRIGDFSTCMNSFPIMSVKYYENALKYFDKQNWNILCFYEESDIKEVSLKIDILKDKFKNLIFLMIDTSISDWKQVVLMSLCKHNIIANSSFSWWGAYFNSNINKIVCRPSLWFGPGTGIKNLNDLCPDNWIKFEQT